MVAISFTTLVTGTSLLLLASASPLVAEKDGKYTTYRHAVPSRPVDLLAGRDNDPTAWTFPANKTSSDDIVPPPEDDDISTFNEIPREFIEKNCDLVKKVKISHSWHEAARLVKAQTEIIPGYNYDIPHSQWLGKDWNSGGYRKTIQNNFKRLNKLFSNKAQKHDNICDGDVILYEWDSIGTFWSNHYVAFCDIFYDYLTTLDNVLEKYDNDIQGQKVMENFRNNRATSMLHETYHMKYLVTYPKAMDYAYGPQTCWNFAKDGGSKWTYVNADSYAIDATAIYVQQHYKSSMSPIPYKELLKQQPNAVSGLAAPSTKNLTIKTFDAAPDGWKGPLPDGDRRDMSVWQALSDVGDTASPTPSSEPALPKLNCNGLDNKKWMDRHVLNGNIGTFCEAAEKQGAHDKDSASLRREYNTDNGDHVVISIDWPVGSSFKPEKDDCVKYLSQVMDTCDADADNNPLNWKHGGNMYLANGQIRYNIVPLAEKYLAGKCSMHVNQIDDFIGKDLPGLERHHDYSVSIDAKDSDGNIFAGTNGKHEHCGDGDPFKLKAYYAIMEITPEAQGGDYIQFTMAGQSWNSLRKDGRTRCNVGAWSSALSPADRDMDCFFDC